MVTDLDRLKLRLAQDEAVLRQLGWIVEWGRQSSHKRIFLHARRRGPGITDEVMITVKLSKDGMSSQKKRYILPRISREWLKCNETSFWGFIHNGSSGILKEGTRKQPSICECKKFTHVALSRARRSAEEIKIKYGTGALQRAYRCAINIRAFHLTSHRNGKPIPGAYAYFDKRKERVN